MIVPGSAVDTARWPPALAHLLGGDVSSTLGGLVAGAAGTITSWRAHQVTHRVGRSTVVQFRVRTELPSGRASNATVVLAHGLAGDLAAERYRSGDLHLHGWRVPDDPLLPGLARALDPDRVAALLDLIGRPVGAPVLRRRAYRPGRRAVVEVTGPAGRVFLKVVRPGRAAELADVHHRSGRTLPVPRVLGCTTDGIVVLSALPGRTLRHALTDIDSDDPDAVDRLPDLDAIEGHLDRLPGAGGRPDANGGPPTLRSPLRTLERHVALLATIQSELGPSLLELSDDVARRVRSDHEVVATHGDLYESQLMVTRGSSPRICGVLDLDTVATGHRVDDLANLCAHLSILALRSASTSDPPAPLGDPATPVGRYLASVAAAAEARHDPVDLRARVAARVVGLATGPFRVQEQDWPAATARRVDLAGAWLADLE